MAWEPFDTFFYIAPEPVPGLQRQSIGPFANEPPWILKDYEGMGSNNTTAITQKIPFQIGETFINTNVNPRVCSITLRVIGQPTEVDGEPFSAVENLIFLKDLLARVMVVQPIIPTEPGERPTMGQLVYVRGDPFNPFRPQVILDVVPRNSPQFTLLEGTDTAVDADLEFVAPDPYWRDRFATNVTLQQEQFGLEFPVEFPIEFTSSGIEQEIVNEGDVRTPILARFFGPITNPRLRNKSTNQIISLTVDIADGDHVEVNTAPGEKTVRYFDGATQTYSNILSSLNFETSEFWELRRGTNVVRFEADARDETSHVIITYRQRYAGV